MRTNYKVTKYGIFYLVTLEPLDRVRIFIVASIKKVFDYVVLEIKSAQHIKSSGNVKKFRLSIDYYFLQPSIRSSSIAIQGLCLERARVRIQLF